VAARLTSISQPIRSVTIRAIYLKDIWPSAKEISAFVRNVIARPLPRYKDVFKGDVAWRKIKVTRGMTYAWDAASTYVANPPYFDNMSMTPAAVTDVKDARILGLFIDSITTDHISPADLVGQMNTALRIPGLANGWTMPVKARIDMLSTGIRTPVGLKISGADVGVIEDIGAQIESVLPAAFLRSGPGVVIFSTSSGTASNWPFPA
jgi:hypothetical protein